MKAKRHRKKIFKKKIAGKEGEESMELARPFADEVPSEEEVAREEQARTVNCLAARAHLLRDDISARRGSRGHLWMDNDYPELRTLEIWVVAHGGRSFLLTGIPVSDAEWHSQETVEAYQTRFDWFVNSFVLIAPTWNWNRIGSYLDALVTEDGVPKASARLVLRVLFADIFCRACNMVLPNSGCCTAYECGDCRTLFNRSTSYNGRTHRCPLCRKIGRKVDDVACSKCAGPQEWTELYECRLCGKKDLSAFWAEHYDSHIDYSW